MMITMTMMSMMMIMMSMMTPDMATINILLEGKRYTSESSGFIHIISNEAEMFTRVALSTNSDNHE